MKWRFFALRPDAKEIWSNERIMEKLKTYKKIVEHEKKPRHVLAKIFPVDKKLYGLKEVDDLLEFQEEYKTQFQEFCNKYYNDEKNIKIDKTDFKKNSYFELKRRIATKMLKNCILCEHQCKVNRHEKKGWCKLGVYNRVASVFVHLGEEAPLVPSGTVFFEGCTFKCVFCQNYDISNEWSPTNGASITSREELASHFVFLETEGARNINLVGGEPTPHIPGILNALDLVDLKIPLVWNSNMYLSNEGMSIIEDIVDVWLPDFKYGPSDCARELSKIRNYWQITTRNFKRMCMIGSKEILVRHLIIPGHLECCTIPIIEFLEELKDHVILNLMDQYYPTYLVPKNPAYKKINRRINAMEIKKAKEVANHHHLVLI